MDDTSPRSFDQSVALPSLPMELLYESALQVSGRSALSISALSERLLILTRTEMICGSRVLFASRDLTPFPNRKSKRVLDFAMPTTGQLPSTSCQIDGPGTDLRLSEV